MSNKTRWLLIILVALAGHFMDGWSYPPHATDLGWVLWHAVNWLRRDIVLIILLWPVIMGKTKSESFGATGYFKTFWTYNVRTRFDTPERISLWTLAAVANFMLHHLLYWLAENTRSILQ